MKDKRQRDYPMKIPLKESLKDFFDKFSLQAEKEDDDWD